MKVESTFRCFEMVVSFFLLDLKISEVQILKICTLIDLKILYTDYLKLVDNGWYYIRNR